MVVLLLGLTLACGNATRRPAWTDGVQHRSYPAGRYLQGLGSATIEGNADEAMRRAEQAARAELTKQIRISIAAVSSSSTVIEQQQAQEHFRETAQRRYLQASQETALVDDISGLSITQRYADTDRGTAFALAVLDLDQAGHALMCTIEDLRTRTSLHLEAAKAASNGACASLRELCKAYEVAEETLTQELLYHAMFGRPAPREKKEISSSALEEMFARVARTFRLEKVDGDGQQGLPGQALAKPFKVRLIKHQSDAPTEPVADCPLYFAPEEGSKIELLERDTTDTHGEAASPVVRVENTNAKTHLVRVGLDQQVFPAHLAAHGPSLEFTFRVPDRAESRLGLHLVETNLNHPVRDPVAEPLLAEALTGAGYRLVPLPFKLSRLASPGPEEYAKLAAKGVDFLLVGSLRSSLLNPGEFVCANGSAELSLIALQSGRQVLTLTVTPRRTAAEKGFDTRGFGPTNELAGLAALRKTAEHAGRLLVEGLTTIFGPPTPIP
ncbi:MAG: hypothetical protein A2284_13265 [Deltaproteobacteria bacterium RIFOXYA12_FULL_61_11]|nr:MAG: hypothetical protein A2284_13265 [Deltaproteobacteria bacterium RIFOXYA12_FULL_61_11]